MNVSITLVGKPVITAALDTIRNSGNLQQLGARTYVNVSSLKDARLKETLTSGSELAIAHVFMEHTQHAACFNTFFLY